MNVHLGTEMHSFIVTNLGNRTTIIRDLPRVPPLDSAHFTLQSASSRINQWLLKNALKYAHLLDVNCSFSVIFALPCTQPRLIQQAASCSIESCLLTWAMNHRYTALAETSAIFEQIYTGNLCITISISEGCTSRADSE